MTLRHPQLMLRLYVILSLLVLPLQAHAQGSQPSDSVRAAEDSARQARREGRQAHRDSARKARTPLTPELRANAYRDAAAREIITRARIARLQQDSSIISYEANTLQRMSAGLSVRERGRNRLAFRTETATRVRWHRESGAWIDVLGTRTAMPMAFPGARAIAGVVEMSPVPYFPGREGLLRFTGMERVTDQEGLFIHPLAEGAEAYYRYAAGDTISYTLPDGRTIRIVEVTVRAREPAFDLIVGSLWFDLTSVQAVRAAYRPAAPFDIRKFVEEEDEDEFDDVPRAVRPMIFPMIATVESFTVEYGLHRSQWWLPRLHSVTGRMQVGIMHSPFEALVSFSYGEVNGLERLPEIVVDTTPRKPSEINIEVGRGERRRSKNGFEGCAPGDTLTRTELRYGKTVKVATRIPCDTLALVSAPELPPSIYASGEELFGERERKALEEELSVGLQPEWAPRAIDISYLQRGLIRYNRVEGLSLGASLSQELGRGLSWTLAGRIGHADLEPNGSLRLVRGDASGGLGIGIYRRLAVADDWGAPLGLGNSINAFLFGRDEGFYYRAAGIELFGALGPAEWRLFGEQQRSARLETQLSLAHAINGLRFRENIAADRVDVAGASVRLPFSYGVDPRTLRLNGETRLEGATGDAEYVRGALDVTMSRSLPWNLAGALTLGAGTTSGSVPTQRLWYLGGTHTVRGHGIGTMAGNAYWITRAELATDQLAFRPVIFFDAGWAGDRDDWSEPGQPMLGGGLGWSILDGLVRMDLAKGIRPNRGVRASLYLDANF